MKLYLDKDVLGCWKRSHTMDDERKEEPSMENGCEDILESLRSFLLLSFVIHSKWSGQIVWNVCGAILHCAILPVLFLQRQPTRELSPTTERKLEGTSREVDRRSVGDKAFAL